MTAFRLFTAFFLTGALSVPALSTITLPIEVMSSTGGAVTESVTVTVPNAAGADALWMQVHGLSYPNPITPMDKASVRVNGSAWIPLNNTTANVADPGKSYGGIGGAFAVLKLSVPLPPGTVVDGTNTIDFRFNGTDGISAGFRVLKFNLLAGSTPLLPTSAFTDDDPAAWTAPSDGNPARGGTLFTSATLLQSPLAGAPAIRARCNMCHTREGRDLKYFNYSNKSIYARSRFHGLSHQDAQDIVAYIRTLATPAAPKGRPWNPPYQPGPGLDSRPLREWAAGAGIEWALDKDMDTFPYLFPNGVSADAVRPQNYINVREIPVIMQFPDWNHWLPIIHPIDAWGDEFANAPAFTEYERIRAAIAGGDFGTFREGDALWGVRLGELLLPRILPQYNPPWTPDYAEKIYSSGRWRLVKEWEMMTEFGLETKAFNVMAGIRPELAEPRGWWQNTPFMTSPNMLHIPRTAENTLRGSPVYTEYFVNVWYHVQLVLFSHRWNDGNTPEDWGYVWGVIKDLRRVSDFPEIMRVLVFFIKSGQIAHNGRGPEYTLTGWRTTSEMDPSRLVWLFSDFWRDAGDTLRRQISQALLQAWHEENLNFDLAQFRTSVEPDGGALASPDDVPTLAPDGRFVDRVWFMIPRFRGWGVDEALLGSVLDWAKRLWPKGAWDLARTGTEVPSVGFDDPYDGSFDDPAELRLHAVAPLIPIDGIAFYDNGVKIGDATNTSNREYYFAWPAPAAGTHRVQAVARIGTDVLPSGIRTYEIRRTGQTPIQGPVITVSVTPSVVTVNPGETIAFTGSVAGTADSRVAWTVWGGGGGISLDGVFTAPAVVAQPLTLSIRGYSLADPSKTATAQVTVRPGTVPVRVAMSPPAFSLGPGQSRALTWSVNDVPGKAVRWSWLPLMGQVTPSGVYRAPLSIPERQTVTITATSVADPMQSAQTVVTLEKTATPEPGSTSVARAKVRVYPNPWRAGQNDITFGGAPAGTDIKIFSVSGHLVRRFVSDSSLATWNLRNSAGESVASGLYLFSARFPDGAQVKGQLAVIR